MRLSEYIKLFVDDETVAPLSVGQIEKVIGGDVVEFRDVVYRHGVHWKRRRDYYRLGVSVYETEWRDGRELDTRLIGVVEYED